jgi:putative endonuclease
MNEHKEKAVKGFSAKYELNRLVYYEEHEDSFSAFERERQLIKWKRKWKLESIEKHNPKWKDLSEDWE